MPVHAVRADRIHCLEARSAAIGEPLKGPRRLGIEADGVGGQRCSGDLGALQRGRGSNLQR